MASVSRKEGPDQIQPLSILLLPTVSRSCNGRSGPLTAIGARWQSIGGAFSPYASRE